MESIISLIVTMAWLFFILRFIKGINRKAANRNREVGKQDAGYTFTHIAEPLPVQKKRQEKPHVHAGETTGYLHEKAILDEKKHAGEERETKRRLAEKSKGMIPATRLYLGDPIPNNCRCVTCSYCAAENLIPYGNNKNYCCYFCREEL